MTLFAYAAELELNIVGSAFPQAQRTVARRGNSRTTLSASSDYRKLPNHCRPACCRCCFEIRQILQPLDLFLSNPFPWQQQNYLPSTTT
jgi:hypothetical protein